MSRVAARPSPRTSGSFAVYTSSYSRFGLKPSFTQSRVGSGVPGNGTVRQSANAQAARGTTATPPFTPVVVSDVAVVSVHLPCSALAGGRAGAPAPINLGRSSRVFLRVAGLGTR